MCFLGFSGALNIASTSALLADAREAEAQSRLTPAAVRHAATVDTLGLETDQYPNVEPCVLFVKKSDGFAKGSFNVDREGVPVSADCEKSRDFFYECMESAKHVGLV